MAPLRLLNLIALVAIAIVALSSGPVRVNALVADRAQLARNVHAHDAVAKRKRSDSSGQCKPRPSSSSPPASTPNPPTPSSTAPSSTAPPASSTTSPVLASTSSSTGGNWCLAWGADTAFLPHFNFPKVKYVYNWGPNPPTGAGLQSMMMLWNNTADKIDAFEQAVNADNGNVNIAMGFNEPNEPGQGNMTPEQAITTWNTNIAPLSQKGFHLVSPACTNDDAGLEWYKEWFNSGPHVDYLAFHGYTTNATAIIEYATNLHNAYGLPIMMTEFACQDFSPNPVQLDEAGVWAFAKQIKDFVESTSWMTACPFGIMFDLQGVNSYNSLLNSDGTPSSLAQYYFS